MVLHEMFTRFETEVTATFLQTNRFPLSEVDVATTQIQNLYPHFIFKAREKKNIVGKVATFTKSIEKISIYRNENSFTVKIFVFLKRKDKKH